jgi:hypothetical protein
MNRAPRDSGILGDDCGGINSLEYEKRMKLREMHEIEVEK